MTFCLVLCTDIQTHLWGISPKGVGDLFQCHLPINHRNTEEKDEIIQILYMTFLNIKNDKDKKDIIMNRAVVIVISNRNRL